MTNELTEKTFEDLKRIKDGVECWSARDLMPILGYAKWSNFKLAIDKAKKASKSSGQQTLNHFTDVGKMIESQAVVFSIPEITTLVSACKLCTY